MSLSDRIRPDVEAEPWVIEEVKKLEAENEQLRKERQAFKDVTEYQKSENAKLREVNKMPDMRINKRGGKRRNAHWTALTPEQVRTARRLRLAGMSCKELQASFEVSRDCLRKALYGLGAYEGIV